MTTFDNNSGKIRRPTPPSNGPQGTPQGALAVAEEKPTTVDQNLDGTQANKGMLADEVARLLNTPRRNASRILDAVLDAVTDLLKAHGRVAVKRFGTFERRMRKGRAYKHPLTGKSIDVPDKETILFKPSFNLIVDSRPGSGGKPTSGH